MSTEENKRWQKLYGDRLPELRDKIVFGKKSDEEKKRALAGVNDKMREEFEKAGEVYRFVGTTPPVRELMETCQIRSPYAERFEGNYVSMTTNPYLRYGGIRLSFDKKCLAKKNKLTPLRYVEGIEECEKLGGKCGEDCTGVQFLSEEEVRVRPKEAKTVVDCDCLKEVTVLLKNPQADSSAFRREVLEQDNRANKQRFKILQKIVKNVPLKMESLTEHYEG